MLDLAATAIEAGRTPRVVTVVPMAFDFEETPVSPELVLVDPALRVQLAMRESVSSEVVDPPHGSAPIDVPAPVPVAQVVPDCESLVSPETMLVDPDSRRHRGMLFREWSSPRRRFAGVVVAVALSAAVSVGVFGASLSDHRGSPTESAGRTPPAVPLQAKAIAATALRANDTAARTPPGPLTRRKATAETAPRAVNPTLSTPRPISGTRTAAVGLRAGVATPSRPWLGWPPVAKASAYVVEITHNGESIYSATTSVPHVHVPGRWRRDGHTVTLAPGTYSWYVWPILRVGSTTRKSTPTVVASKLEITR